MGFVLYKGSGIFIGTWVLELMESLEEKVDVGVARRSADFSKRNIIRCYRFFKRNVDYLLSDGFAMGAGWSAGTSGLGVQ